MTILLLILSAVSAAIGALLAFDKDRNVDLGIRAAAGVLFGGIAVILSLAAFGVI